jgi:F plasmid transfer operon, TraF, protein
LLIHTFIYLRSNFLKHFFKHKAVVVALGACLVSAAALANQSLVGAGFSMSTGYVTNPHNLHSANHNPAGLDFLVAPKSSFRMGYVLPNLGLQTEFGDAVGMKETIDKIDAITKKTYTTQADLDAAKLQLSGLLPQLENGGQFSVGANITPLLTPFLWRSERLNGVISFNLDAELQLRGQFLAAPVTQSGSGTNLKAETNSGFDLHAVLLQRYALGYGSAPLSDYRDTSERWGRIDFGGRLALLSASTRRDYKMTNSDNTSNSNDLPAATATSVGIDLGVMNTHDSFQLGLTGYNLNSPSFKFPDLSSTAAVSQQQAGKLSLSETAQMKAHFVMEGSWFSENRRWMLQASHALNPTTNLVGEERQYSTLSGGYYPKFESRVANFFTPTLRVGLRKNQVGSQLTTTSLGLTLFQALNIDYWTSAESTSYETGKTIPRFVGLSIGLTSSY